MKITDNKYLVFLHVLDAMALAALPLEAKVFKRVRGEFEGLFSAELAAARGEAALQKGFVDGFCKRCKKRLKPGLEAYAGVCRKCREIEKQKEEKEYV